MGAGVVPSVPIGSLVEKVSSWNPARDAPDEELSYIDLSSVDNQLKAVTANQVVLGCEAPSRARQSVMAGDILVSTVRPNLNGVARVPRYLDGATASTGFCVLRPKPSKLDPSYLFHWVMSDAFIDDMVRKATGASYPAVSDRIIFNSEIPLPPLEEQKRIAAILDQADDIRHKRQHAIDRLNQLGQAIFHEMFGKEGATVKISEYLDDIQSGKNLVGVSDDDESDFRVLKISAVSRMGFRPSETKPLPSNYIPPSEHLVSNGDLIFSRANTTELVGIPCIVEGVEPNVALPDKLWRLVATPQKADPQFLNYALRAPSSRQQIEKICSGTSGSMQNISMQKFNSILIPKAPLSDQRQFAERVGQVSAVLEQVSLQKRTANSLFASLQHRAFRGEL